MGKSEINMTQNNKSLDYSLRKDEVILYRIFNSRFEGSIDCLVHDVKSDEMIIRQLGKDQGWYDIDYIEGYSPFIDLIHELLEK